jgi:hypothetical protein
MYFTMNPPPRTARTIALAATLASLVMAGCSSTLGHGQGDGGGSTMMGDGSGYHTSTRTCSTPDSLPGTQVRVSLFDMDVSKMMGDVAPGGARMRLLSSTVRAGTGRRCSWMGRPCASRRTTPKADGVCPYVRPPSALSAPITTWRAAEPGWDDKQPSVTGRSPRSPGCARSLTMAPTRTARNVADPGRSAVRVHARVT